MHVLRLPPALDSPIGHRHQVHDLLVTPLIRLHSHSDPKQMHFTTYDDIAVEFQLRGVTIKFSNYHQLHARSGHVQPVVQFNQSGPLCRQRALHRAQVPGQPLPNAGQPLGQQQQSSRIPVYQPHHSVWVLSLGSQHQLPHPQRRGHQRTIRPDLRRRQH